MAKKIPETAKVIVVPIGIDVYQQPKKNQGGRNGFRPLEEVNKDISRLSEVFSSPTYSDAGFYVAPVIRGTYLNVYEKLNRAVDQIQRVPGRRLIVLWNGHAELAKGREFRLATSDSLSPMEPREGWGPGDLVDTLSAAQVRGLYVVLDVCWAGQAAGLLVAQAAQRMMDTPPTRGALPGFAAICSAQPYEQAKDGLFAGVLATVLSSGASPESRGLMEGRGGGGGLVHNRLLTPNELNGVLEAEFEVLSEKDSLVQQPSPASLGVDLPVFPNPLYQPEAPPRTLDRLGDYVSAADAEQHFLPKARGMEPGELGWNFTGREDASRAVSDFIAQRVDESLLVVTGDAGAGKSALIGRAVALTDADFRASLERGTDWSEGDDRRRRMLPPLNGVDAALHLRGLTGAGVARSLADLLGLDTPGSLGMSTFVDQVVEHGRSRQEPLILVLDALDEAEEPSAIAASLIKPLAERGGARIVVGTRKSASVRGAEDLLDSLGASPVLDLSADEDSARDIAAYVERRLSSDDSPYVRRSRLRREIGAAVAKKAPHVFLYAKLTVDELLNSPIDTVEEISDAVTTGVGTAFERTLTRLDEEFAARFATGVAGATALALGLAWGQGLGIPLRDHLWPLVATAAADSALQLTDEHCSWFLTQAGKYVLESGDGQQAVYRLYHEALHEHLREITSDADSVRARVASVLRGVVDTSGGWQFANPFLVRYLPLYVDGEHELEQLCTDPTYLKRLIEVLGVDGAIRTLVRIRTAAPTPAITAVSKVVRRARVALDRDPSQLAAQLRTRLGGEQDPAIVRLVQTAWSIAPPVWLDPFTARLDWNAEMQTTQTFADKVRALAPAIIGGDAVLFVGAGSTICAWDPRYGGMRAVFPNDDLRPIALATGPMDDARTAVAASSYEQRITVRNADTGELICPPIDTGGAYVPSVAVAAPARPEDLPDDVRSAALDDTAAVFWSELGSRLCTVRGRLGVITRRASGYEIRVAGESEPLTFELTEGDPGREPVLTVSEHRGELVLAEAVGSVVRFARWGESFSRSIDVNFPVRCLAATWVDGTPIVAASNDSDPQATASYVTIREPLRISLEKPQELSVVGVGYWELRLVALLHDGGVFDVLTHSRIVGARAAEVTPASGARRALVPDLETPVSGVRASTKAVFYSEIDGKAVVARGGFDGRVWVWREGTDAYLGPFGRPGVLDREFRPAKGRERDAISAVTLGHDGNTRWVVAADSRGVVCYDLTTRHPVSQLTVGSSSVTALAIDSDDAHTHLATGSDGGGLAVWDVRTGSRLAGFTMDDPVTGLWLVGAMLIVQTGARPLSCFQLLGVEHTG